LKKGFKITLLPCSNKFFYRYKVFFVNVDKIYFISITDKMSFR
jgi:hypothetical protein